MLHLSGSRNELTCPKNLFLTFFTTLPFTRSQEKIYNVIGTDVHQLVLFVYL